MSLLELAYMILIFDCLASTLCLMSYVSKIYTYLSIYLDYPSKKNSCQQFLYWLDMRRGCWLVNYPFLTLEFAQ